MLADQPTRTRRRRRRTRRATGPARGRRRRRARRGWTGRVMRRKVCTGPAPRVVAACSCSSPISSSTGPTARTTSGSETKMVASTMPGIEKMILMPIAAEQPPTPVEPAVDQDQREADDDRRDGERQVDQRVERPACRGTRGGRAAARRRRRRRCWRRPRQNATTRVIWNACSVDAVVSASKTAPRPCSNVRQQDQPDRQHEQERAGRRAPAMRSSSRTPVRRSATAWARALATARRPALQQVERDQHDEGHQQQHGRDRGRAGRRCRSRSGCRCAPPPPGS